MDKKSILEELYWFGKYYLHTLKEELKSLLGSLNTYITVIIMFVVYLFMFKKDTRFWFLWVIAVLLLLFDIYRRNHWRNYMRKQKRKKYFAKEHPDKAKKESKAKKV